MNDEFEDDGEFQDEFDHDAGRSYVRRNISTGLPFKPAKPYNRKYMRDYRKDVLRMKPHTDWQKSASQVDILWSGLVKLAYENPSLRGAILPLVEWDKTK